MNGIAEIGERIALDDNAPAWVGRAVEDRYGIGNGSLQSQPKRWQLTLEFGVLFGDMLQGRVIQAHSGQARPSRNGDGTVPVSHFCAAYAGRRVCSIGDSNGFSWLS